MVDFCDQESTTLLIQPPRPLFAGLSDFPASKTDRHAIPILAAPLYVMETKTY